VFGNHDVLYNGFIGQDDSLRTLATGSLKYWSVPSCMSDDLLGVSLDTSPIQRMLNHVRQPLAVTGGFKPVGADPARRLLQGTDFRAAHFEDTGNGPGPAALVSWLGIGVAAWWLLTAWALIWRGTPVGAAADPAGAIAPATGAAASPGPADQAG
jgi:hypothetical protein